MTKTFDHVNSYIQGKQHTIKLPKSSTTTSNDMQDLIHSDVFEPLNPQLIYDVNTFKHSLMIKLGIPPFIY
jgi:hypothetical protein